MKKAELATLRTNVAIAAQKLRSAGCKTLAFPEEHISVASPAQLRSWLLWAEDTYTNLYA
jgi:hypothetical protein